MIQLNSQFKRISNLRDNGVSAEKLVSRIKKVYDIANSPTVGEKLDAQISEVADKFFGIIKQYVNHIDNSVNN